jgi:SAM-dependent methyltransferase
VILAAVPDGARRSLDVGCGVGMLARDLRRVVPQVTAIDRDAASVDVARRADAGEGIDYLVGDFMTHPFAPGSFDHIASIAALHHMDAAAALARMAELLAPGGTLAVVGLARARYPADLPFAAAGAVGHRVLAVRRTYWEDSAPRLWPRSARGRRGERIQRLTRSPRPQARVGEAAAAPTAHEVDDQRRRGDRDDDPACVAPARDRQRHEPADERAGDADEDRHADAHRVGSRERQTRERPDDEAGEGKDDQVDEQAHALDGSASRT